MRSKIFPFCLLFCKIVVISPLSKHSMSVTDICRLYISCLCNFLVYKEFHLSCWNFVKKKKKENPIIFPYYHFYVHSICLCSDALSLLILIIFAFSLFLSWPILLKLQFDKSFRGLVFSTVCKFSILLTFYHYFSFIYAI